MTPSAPPSEPPAAAATDGPATRFSDGQNRGSGPNKMNVQVLSNRARTAALVEARGGAHETLGISAFDGRVP